MFGRCCVLIRQKISNVRFKSIDYKSKCEGLTVEPKDQVLWIKFDRPQKYNAISAEMYDQLSDSFTQVNEDKSIKAVVLTGNGDYYSSGNDLNNFARAMQDPGGPQVGLTKSKNILLRFVDSIINVNKLLIAGVNGPAVGIPVTTLPLFDYVVASDNATFQTPFTALGQCPEACSSVTFPDMMGFGKASELLFLNMTWSVDKALKNGLVNDVVDKSKLAPFLDNLLYGKQGIVNACYPHSLKISKSLVRNPSTKQRLLETNRLECEAILKLWLGPECADAIQKFSKRTRNN